MLRNLWGGKRRGSGQERATAKPLDHFHSTHYLRHNARRLEHLSSLSLGVRGRSVLDVGAGVGDHSHYYIDRECKVTIAESRAENLTVLRERYPLERIERLDMEQPHGIDGGPFEIVHCYGLLYHLSNPEGALRYLSSQCSHMLLLETCVSFGDDSVVHLVQEDAANPTQSASGTGCRPTRRWVFQSLQQLFPHVYIPVTQPNHEEFPVDWTVSAPRHRGLSRAVFVACREPLANALLSTELLQLQARHD